MKELLKLKGDLHTEIKEIEEILEQNKDTKNFTGITVMKNKIEQKKDLLRLITILYPML